MSDKSSLKIKHSVLSMEPKYDTKKMKPAETSLRCWKLNHLIDCDVIQL